MHMAGHLYAEHTMSALAAKPDSICVARTLTAPVCCALWLCEADVLAVNVWHPWPKTAFRPSGCKVPSHLCCAHASASVHAWRVHIRTTHHGMHLQLYLAILRIPQMAPDPKKAPPAKKKATKAAPKTAKKATHAKRASKAKKKAK